MEKYPRYCIYYHIFPMAASSMIPLLCINGYKGIGNATLAQSNFLGEIF